MKLDRRFKAVLLWTCGVLYATGAAVWVLGRFYQTDSGYGPEPSPLKAPVLHAHSVAGLLFLAVFGYLWRAHVEPGLRQRKKRRSGWSMLAVFAVLFLTVPALFYATGETSRAWAAFIHTWVGAAALAPFLIHLRSPRAAHAGHAHGHAHSSR